ncbi:hypothetical protein [Rhodanobacter umsongensis]
MYFSISDLKLTQIDSATKGAIFVGTEINGGNRPSCCVVIDGGRQVAEKLVLGLSGKGAFVADRLGQSSAISGLALPPADLVMLDFGDSKPSPFNGSLQVGQLLVTTQSAYLGIDWFHGNMRNFALVNLQTWTLESYVDLNNSGVKQALLVNWRLVYRHQDQTVVLAESVKAEPA